MRFLIFNIASIAALVYLLWGQPSRIEAGNVAAAIRDAGVAAIRGVGQATPQIAEPKAEASPIPVPRTEPVKAASSGVVENSPAPQANAPTPTAPAARPIEVAAVPVLGPLPVPARELLPVPLPSREVPMRPVPKSAPLDATVAPGLPRAAGRHPAPPMVDDPAVATRRDEVLGRTGDTESTGAGRQPVRRAESAEFMSARDRRRELQRLAEEMELLYAEKVHR